MKYIITEKDFHYRPGDDVGVVYTNEIVTKADTINKVLEKCMAFAVSFQEVEATHWYANTIIELRSNMNSDKITHPEYFYTQRHELVVDVIND